MPIPSPRRRTSRLKASQARFQPPASYTARAPTVYSRELCLSAIDIYDDTATHVALKDFLRLRR
jgi:hypothetical protein